MEVSGGGNLGFALLLTLAAGLATGLGSVAALLLRPPVSPETLGWMLAAVAGLMVFISIDELVPASRSFGHEHLSIFGVVAGMAVMATSLGLLARDEGVALHLHLPGRQGKYVDKHSYLDKQASTKINIYRLIFVKEYWIYNSGLTISHDIRILNQAIRIFPDHQANQGHCCPTVLK